MNTSIISEIEGIKRKILNEIEMLKHNKELNYLCDYLTSVLNNMEYDNTDDLSLKKYKARLEVFLSLVMGYLNKILLSKTNESIFDNTTEEHNNKRKELESSIEEDINYLVTNIPFLGENLLDKYSKLKNKYNLEFDETINSTKRRLNVDLGIIDEPIYSLYPDTNTVCSSYINTLIAFKSLYIDPLKQLIDNDKKVREIFKRAYNTLKDEKALDAVKQLEQNYINKVNECCDKKSSLYLLASQETMIRDGLKLDGIVDDEETRLRYERKIKWLDLNSLVDTVLDIEKYVNATGRLSEEFYLAVYALVEKDKYMLRKYNECNHLYERLSDITKANIERIFLKRIEDREDSYEIILKLKKDGYLSVFDENYQTFFNTCEFRIKNDFRLEDYKKDMPYKLDIVRGNFIDTHFNLIEKKTGKRLGSYFNTQERELISIGDIIKFQYVKVRLNSAYKCCVYLDRNGNKLNTPDGIDIIDYAFGYYIAQNGANKEIYDSNFKLVTTIKNIYSLGGELLIDYNSKKSIIINDNTVVLLDENFKKIGEYYLFHLIDDYSSLYWKICDTDKITFNDGVLTIHFIDAYNKEKHTYYYDFNNMKVIDHFEYPADKEFRINFIYSEGIYPFYDKESRKLGYKDITGTVIGNTEYYATYPFINGVALVSDYTTDHLFINRNGETTKCSTMEHGYGFDNIYRYNLRDKYYDQFNAKRESHKVIRNTNSYYIPCRKYISEIDFDNPESIKKIS